jgi:HEAT repeat protein
MRPGLIACAVLICALPADGGTTAVAPAMVDVLMSIDTPPSQPALYDAFGAPPLLPDNRLLALASDPSLDLGVAIRAIRALPAYCPAAPQVCGAGTAAHDALVSLIQGYQSSQHTSQDLLRLRAAAEALGATHSGLASDVDELKPLLGDPSRDVRATVVRALRNICNSTAIPPLTTSLPSEPTMQVRLAIVAALHDLSRCSN